MTVLRPPTLADGMCVARGTVAGYASGKVRSGRGGKAVEPVASGDDNARPPELGEAMADRPFRHAQPGVKR